MGLAAFLITVFSSLVATVLWAEIRGWSPRLSVALRRVAVKRLPFMHRARLSEEWEAYLNEMPTPLSRLSAGLGFVLAAERLRLWQGAKAIRALKDFVYINRGLRPYRKAVSSFGGSNFRIRLVRRPCGNRHVVYHFSGPRVLVELYKSFVETPLELPTDDSALHAMISREGIYARAIALSEAIQNGTVHAKFPHANLEPMGIEADTMQIYWPERDARAARILFAWVWRRKRAWRNRRRFFSQR